jgi:integrase
MSVRVRKKKGAWWVFISHHGRRKAKKVGTREAAEQVKRELEARLTLGDVGIFQPKKNTVSFSEYARQWLEVHAQAHCKVSTYRSYEQTLRSYLEPQFGSLPFDRVTRNDIKRYLSKLAGSKQYGLGTLRKILATLRAILSEAVEDGVIGSNPALRLGKRVFAGLRKRPVEFLTREEAQQFLESTRAHRPRRYPMFFTALRAGLRLGELIALQWDDIQFGTSAEDPNRYILVRRNYSFGEFTTPKNDKPRRVDMGRELRRVLMDLRDALTLAAFEHGEAAISALVFPSSAGSPLNGVNIYHRDFLPCVQAAGLRRITFHALRHSYASHLIHEGASLAYVRDQMGHSSIQVTVDVYGHLIPGADIAWADKLDAETSRHPSATQRQPGESGMDAEARELLENIGGPGRIRTYDQRIMSPLL